MLKSQIQRQINRVKLGSFLIMGSAIPVNFVKIWVVFDCSAEYDGVSLNRRLLSGPNLTNQTVGILVKFREDYVAIMADLEAMFYQVFVANRHRSLLSFL